ncbi:hypothetical protein [Thermodesulfovibrio yellowstonii]|uniref:Uncharacterized protein n=1 Tax=Thermodesulfovibrio yellowstonii TaxID=28262 RepID=A0A9W6GHG6_9BACT|nr:hypothetical protein [Thermodesulfovibrio islandicus]GLI53969.1 hypothetical protein TISLANDTSLP1_16620 [Thermodesulfovibrio islandicus]
MKVYDLLAKDSTVTEEGEKVKWIRVGVLLQKEKGYSVKIDCIPIGTSWDGWLTVKERTEKNEPF